MYTQDGRYYTGHKTYWHVTVNSAGIVVEILAAVKATDNEKRSFQSDVRPLTQDEMAHAMKDTQAHQEVIDAMVRDLYETNIAKEVASGISEQAAAEAPTETVSTDAGSAPAITDAPVTEHGAVLADGQETAGV